MNTHRRCTHGLAKSPSGFRKNHAFDDAVNAKRFARHVARLHREAQRSTQERLARVRSTMRARLSDGTVVAPVASAA